MLGKGPSRFRGAGVPEGGWEPGYPTGLGAGVPEGGWETWGYKEPEGEPHLIFRPIYSSQEQEK